MVRNWMVVAFEWTLVESQVREKAKVEEVVEVVVATAVVVIAMVVAVVVTAMEVVVAVVTAMEVEVVVTVTATMEVVVVAILAVMVITMAVPAPIIATAVEAVVTTKILSENNMFDTVITVLMATLHTISANMLKKRNSCLCLCCVRVSCVIPKAAT
jgi:hypothetical protein